MLYVFPQELKTPSTFTFLLDTHTYTQKENQALPGTLAFLQLLDTNTDPSEPSRLGPLCSLGRDPPSFTQLGLQRALKGVLAPGTPPSWSGFSNSRPKGQIQPAVSSG